MAPKNTTLGQVKKVYDFVIAGGGSSACVLAYKLVKEYGFRVLLIERGPASTSPIYQMPAGFLKFINNCEYFENHITDISNPGFTNRIPIVPQARVLGGGSSINAMVYIRGQREDYDHWDEYLGGRSGWSYRDMLHHFRSMESNSKWGNSQYHGDSGTLQVSDPGNLCDAAKDFLTATQSLGIPFNPDFNGFQQAGVGIIPHTMGKRFFGLPRDEYLGPQGVSEKIGHMQRCDAVTAFLRHVRTDPRLTIITDTNVNKIIIENNRAVGVSYVSFDGTEKIARADREVIISTGTYNTAKLLMLSGIGPADHLKSFDIPVAVDLPGVGQNLQDHHEVPIISQAKGIYGYHGQDVGMKTYMNGLQYLIFNSGPVTTSGIETCMFYDPDGGTRPTIQMYCVPVVYVDRDLQYAHNIQNTYGVTLNSCLLRPKSRGTVTLRSKDPTMLPKVDVNFFGEQEDLDITVKSLKFARKILATEAFTKKIAREMLPGENVTDDKELERYCYRMVKTNYHPVGTAKMGPDHDPMAVLDRDLKVRGIDRLRVVDCSAMPFVPSGNTNAPVLALASKAADLIGDYAYR
jgi:choline dehydrogenase-like flavoprotein